MTVPGRANGAPSSVALGVACVMSVVVAVMVMSRANDEPAESSLAPSKTLIFGGVLSTMNDDWTLVDQFNSSVTTTLSVCVPSLAIGTESENGASSSVATVVVLLTSVISAVTVMSRPKIAP